MNADAFHDGRITLLWGGEIMKKRNTITKSTKGSLLKRNQAFYNNRKRKNNK